MATPIQPLMPSWRRQPGSQIPQNSKSINQGIAILDRDIPAIVWANPVVPMAWWDNVKGHGTATRGIHFWEGMRDEIWWLAK